MARPHIHQPATGGSGPTGPQGLPGSQGAQGPAGPRGQRGPAGRDARVTCKVKRPKRRVVCTVRFKRSVRAGGLRLVKDGRTVARGRANGGRRGVLRAAGGLRAGRYTLVAEGTRARVRIVK